MTGPFAPHVLRSRPSEAWHDLSDFVCSCGQVFVADAMEPSIGRDVPSLGYAHTVVAIKRLAGVSPLRTITDVDGLAHLPETSVVADPTGRLSRFWGRRTLVWRHADGARGNRLDDVAFPLAVWWEPGTDITD